MTHLSPTHPLTQTLCLILALGCSSKVNVAEMDTGGTTSIDANTGGNSPNGGSQGHATGGDYWPGIGGDWATGGTVWSGSGGNWATGGSNAPTGGRYGDGGNSPTGGTVSCDQLQSIAQTTFSNFVAANRACSLDADCVYQGGFALCVNAGCIALNAAAASAAYSVATQACAPSDANNCYVSYHGCPAAFAACVQGTCTPQIGGAGGTGAGGASGTGGKSADGGAANGGTTQRGCTPGQRSNLQRRPNCQFAHGAMQFGPQLLRSRLLRL